MGDPALGSKIKEAREAVGLSQAEFAPRIGLKHPQSVSNYERGVDDVTTDRLRQIAEVTKKPLSFFLDGDEAATPPEPEYLQLVREVLDLQRSGRELLQLIEAKVAAIEARLAERPDTQANGGTR